MNGLVCLFGFTAWMILVLMITKDMRIVPALLVIWGSLAVIYVLWRRHYEKQIEREHDGSES